MWLFTDKAFVSAVQSPTDPDMIVVRARAEIHLYDFIRSNKDINVENMLVTPERDYPYRIFLTRDQFKSLMIEAIDDLNYFDFKSHCKADERFHRHHLEAMTDVWGIMYDSQKRPYTHQGTAYINRHTAKRELGLGPF